MEAEASMEALVRTCGVAFLLVMDAGEGSRDSGSQAVVVKGGQLATTVYAYPRSLHARAAVATLDLSACNSEAFVPDHLLASLGNAAAMPLLLRLDDPVFETQQASCAV